MPWIPVGETPDQMRIFAHNWTRRSARRRKSKLESEHLVGFRFRIHRLGLLDFRVVPEIWEPEDALHEGRLHG